jgi:putative solute:sodium symporter small subunit
MASSSSSAYWRRNTRLILRLLAVWLVLTLAPALFPGWLSFSFIGWPMPFWLGAYGAPLAYLVIVGVYAWAMNRADARAAAEGPASPRES